MTGTDLKSARVAARRTQVEAAKKLGVTQAYLSMVERGVRRVSPELGSRAMAVLDFPPTVLPLKDESATRGAGWFKERLGGLGYSGFQYLGGAKVNPAQLLMDALDSDDLDSRVTEALPWVPLAFPLLDWDWLTSRAKLKDRQNRLGFVVSLASEAAATAQADALASSLRKRADALEHSRLAAEDTLCKASMTQAERKWLREHRTPTARHWNLLSDLNLEQLAYVSV
jgi:transcriptional regulator with XRE-family HTH domain